MWSINLYCQYPAISCEDVVVGSWPELYGEYLDIKCRGNLGVSTIFRNHNLRLKPTSV